MKEKYVVRNNGKKINIKVYLEEVVGLSSRRIKKLLKDKKIYINDKAAYWDNTVTINDIIEIDISEKLNTEIIPQNVAINIIYEDDYILAVNKPPYMLVHPTPNNTEGTLANAVAYHFLANNNRINVRFLNRLDMNTSGVVVIPKSGEIHTALNKQMDNGETVKKYIAIVEGLIHPCEGIINEPLGKHPEDNIKRAVINGGAEAITEYKVLEYLDNMSILELKLITGRTHQIRVHLSFKGYPILGDVLYGTESKIIDRQALHANEMELVHPVNHEKLVLSAKIPDDMNRIVNMSRKQ